MKAVLLGTGSPPPNPQRRGPSTLLSLGAERFLVDAGSGVGVQLVQAGVRPYEWPRLFITHHQLEIWGPAGTRRQVDKLLDYLHWDIEVRRGHMVDRAPPTVTVTEIEEGRLMEAGGVTVSAFLVEHDPVRPAFGYHFEGGGRRIVISGDTRPCENLIRWSQGVDCLIHECCEMAKTAWYPGCGWPSLEEKIRDLASYHTQPDDLGRIAESARAKKLAVTHLMPGSEPRALEHAARRHFAGPLVVGSDLLEV